MAKALNGEFGRLQMLGIRFTEAQKQTILFGTESEKVAAIQEGLAQNLKETTDTVGGVDLAMAKANRAMENISENVGRALAPAFVSLMEKVQPVIEALADWAENNPTLVATLVAAGLAISAIVAGLGFLGLVLPMIIGGFTLLISPVGLIIAGIVALIAVLVYLGTHLEELKEGWTLVFSAIAIGFQGWWAKVSGIFNSFRESISTMWVSIKSTFLDGINFLVGLAEGWANTYVKAANTIIEALNSIQVSVPDWVPGVGGKSFGIDIPLVPEVSLPRFEMGGTVPGARGTATQIIAHGGERIIPAGGSDGGGVNISLVMNYPRFNSRDDVNVVREQLDAALRDVVRNYKLQPA
jgi:phage-related protein